MSIKAYHFWSPTCAPCKAIKPIIQDLKDDFPVIIWVSVNIENDVKGYTAMYNVTSVPTMVVVAYNKAGEEIYKQSHSGTRDNIGYWKLLRDANEAVIKSA